MYKRQKKYGVAFYTDGKIFTPTALSNDGIAYGEAVDQGHISNLLSRPRYTCTGSNLWRLDETYTRGIIRSHGYMPGSYTHLTGIILMTGSI